jgi:hypothetical protein
MLPEQHHPRKQRKRDRIYFFITRGGVKKPADSVRSPPFEELGSLASGIVLGTTGPRGTWGSGKTGVDSETPDEPPFDTVRKKISLWDKAFDTLPQEDREKFPRFSEHQNLIFVTLGNAKIYQNICYEKRWKFNWKGKELLLHDVVSRIMTWIEKFETIGDIVSQYDLSHAVLPWTGFRFLLQVGSTLKFPFTPYREFQVS